MEDIYVSENIKWDVSENIDFMWMWVRIMNRTNPYVDSLIVQGSIIVSSKGKISKPTSQTYPPRNCNEQAQKDGAPLNESTTMSLAQSKGK